jgi:hypothetical protein
MKCLENACSAQTRASRFVTFQPLISLILYETCAVILAFGRITDA